MDITLINKEDMETLKEKEKKVAQKRKEENDKDKEELKVFNVNTTDKSYTNEDINLLHPDVRKYIDNRKISLEDAVKINIFETVEQREQLIKERIKINNWAEKTSSLIEGEWNKNIAIRKQQVIDFHTKGETALKTDFDLQYQRKLDIKTDTTKIVLEIYKACRLILLDLGVIRNTNKDDLDFIDVDCK